MGAILKRGRAFSGLQKNYAYETFCLWAEKYESARLYTELYEDRENDEMFLEDYLLSAGDYPS